MNTHALVLAFTLALAACVGGPRAVLVPAALETAAVNADGDAADDPAIWVAPEPARSRVIATQKQGGIYVFDLGGAIVQEVPGGRPNNVDLRDGFAWLEGDAPIVGASDRSDNAIVLWRLNPETGRLDPTPRARLATGFTEVYGLCLGRRADETIAVATDKGGEVGVWRLSVRSDGAIAGERVAAFNLGSIAEGCVVDDEIGDYYVSQETVGIWRVGLADADGSARRLIDRVGDGNLVADVEGLALWLGRDGAGYLIASVQGRSRFAVYERRNNAYLGAFSVGAGGNADAVSGTDGIDVVSAALPNFPHGVVVVQDDENTDPLAGQNFKYVSWAEVAAGLSLR